MKRLRRFSELPPFDVDLTASLRRAFALPDGYGVGDFDEMLAQIR